MTFDTAHARQADKEQQARRRMVLDQLAKHSPGGNINFDLAALMAGTNQGNIASLVALGVVRGHRTRRTVAVSSLRVWMDTRPKKFVDNDTADR